MKKWIALGLAAAVLVTLAVICTTNFVSTNVRALFSRGQDAIVDNTPDDQVVAVIQVKLGDFDKQIHNYTLSLGRLTDKVAAAETDIADGEKKLEAETGLLRKCKEMLDQKDTTEFVISGKTYDRDQVAADAQSRVAKYKQLESQLDSKRKMHATLKQAVKEGKDNLTKAQVTRRQLAAELEAWKTKLANAKARKEVNEITNAMNGQPLGVDSELGQAIGQLKNRATEADRIADMAGNEARGGQIDWNNTDAEDASKAINEILGGTSSNPVSTQGPPKAKR